MSGEEYVYAAYGVVLFALLLYVVVTGLRSARTAREAELLARLGLTPHEAIQSATRIAAEALRMDRTIGTLEAGKYADLIAVGGDPTVDPSVLYDLRLVVKGGEAVRL